MHTFLAWTETSVKLYILKSKIIFSYSLIHIFCCMVTKSSTFQIGVLCWIFPVCITSLQSAKFYNLQLYIYNSRILLIINRCALIVSSRCIVVSRKWRYLSIFFSTRFSTTIKQPKRQNNLNRCNFIHQNTFLVRKRLRFCKLQPFLKCSMLLNNQSIYELTFRSH